MNFFARAFCSAVSAIRGNGPTNAKVAIVIGRMNAATFISNAALGSMNTLPIDAFDDSRGMMKLPWSG
jgi:hypothetical protein